MTTQNLNPVRKNIALLALALGLAAILPLLASAQTPEDGSAQHPFLIRDIAQLQDLATCVNSGRTFYFTGTTFDTAFAEGYVTIQPGGINKCFSLENDLTLNTGNVAGCNGVKDDAWTEWTPIGTSFADNHFKGEFDGNNHAISGLYTNDPTAIGAGCFGAISSGARVHNLAVTNSYFRAGSYVGGIAGLNIACSIDSCLNASTVIAAATNNLGGLFAGGICGSNTVTSSGHSYIRYCVNAGYVLAETENGGGIAGANGNGCTIDHCLTYNHSKGPAEISSVRPLCGVNDGTVSDSYFDLYLSPSSNGLSEYGTGVATSVVTNAAWQLLGSDFVYTMGFYPQLRCFASASPSLSKLVATPITLSALDQDITGLVNDIALGGSSVSVAWTATNPTRSNISGNTLQLLAQGRFVLTASLAGYAKAYYLVSQKEPLVGTEANPFIIASIQDLTDFQKGINSGRTFTLDGFTVPIRGASTHFLLAKDLDLNPAMSDHYMDYEGSVSPDRVWTPVGTSEQPFQGNFNGGGHALAGLFNNNIFGYVNGGTVRNLALVRSSCGAMVYSLSAGSSLSGCINAANLRLNQPALVTQNNGSVSNCLSAVTFVGNRYIAPFDDTTSSDHCLSIVNNCSRLSILIANSQPSNIVDTSIAYANVYDIPAFRSSEMLGTALQTTLGGGWHYQSGSYPVPSAFAGTDVGKAVAAPVLLAGNENAWKVRSNFTLGGNPDVDWQVSRGNGISVSGSSATISHFGQTYLTASANGKAYKTVKLNVYNPSEDVFYIKDKEQLGSFRDGINSRREFYYSPTDSTYSLTYDDQHTITVNACGLGQHFVQTADITFDNDTAAYDPASKIIIMQHVGTETVTVRKARVLDPGGINLYYKSCYSTLTLLPQTPGKKLRIRGEYNLETNYDILRIYNGTSTSATLLGAYSAAAGSINVLRRDLVGGTIDLVSTDPTGALTLYFMSDHNYERWGFELTVSEEPEELEETEVWSPIEINPTGIFPTTLIPTNGTTSTIVVNEQGYLFDGGGPSSDYGVNQSGTVILKPVTPGAKVHIEGFGGFEGRDDCDVLTIYNGVGKDDVLYRYFSAKTLPVSATSTDPSGALTVHFKSDISNVNWGFRIKYSLIDTRNNTTNENGFEYDGNGHSISNIVGPLFDTLQLARIHHLNIDNAMTSEASSLLGASGVLSNSCFQSEISDCNVNALSLNYFNTIGGFVGYVESSAIRHCHFKGELSAPGYVGGIAGKGDLVLVEHCSTEGNLEGQLYVGGIFGKSGSFDTIRHCQNAASLHNQNHNNGTVYLGGIVGSMTNISLVEQCVNTGAITTAAAGTNIGGIAAYGGSLNLCLNTGALLAMKFTNVGGIAGTSATVNNSINAGGVQLGTGTGVGAIGGSSVTATNCYNIGGLQWISVSSSGTNSNVHSDQQMCPEFAGTATQHLTLAMLGDSLKGKLGADSNWVFTAGMYPRIKGLENEPASIAAATPVLLDEGEDVLSVNSDFTMGTGTATNTQWHLVEGTALALDSTNNSRAEVTGTGIVTVGAAVLPDSTVLKKVELYVGYDREFIVRNLEELMNFRDCINSDSIFFYDPTPGAEHYALTQENINMIPVPASGKTISFRLTSDIDMDTITSWDPIGNFRQEQNYPSFKGSFNGGNHIIRNMTITGGSQSYLGLFGITSDFSKLKNFRFENVRITTTGDYVGALAGYSGYHIDSCNVSRATVSGGNFTAGLVGYNKGHLYSCRVDSSNVRGVKAVDTEQTGIALSVAGVAGVCIDSVCNCVAVSDTVFAKNTLTINDWACLIVGGIVGEAKSAVLHCRAENDTLYGENISSTYGTWASSGCVAGLVRGTLYDCSTQGGKVLTKCSLYSGNTYHNRYYFGTGGVAGAAGGDVSYCYNRGTEVTGFISTGGVVGFCYAQRKKCSYCGNTGTVSGYQQTGGIVGSCAQWVTFNYCYNTAPVSARQQGDKSNTCGGIVAYTGDCNLNFCFNTGRITGSSVSGGNTGGLAGYNNNGNVNYCYNAGEVVGNRAPYAGGIAGQGAVRYSYNIGRVKGGVTCNGGLSGMSDAPTKSYIDKQMCPGTTYHTGDTLTSALLGTRLSGGKMAANVACDSNWVFVDGLYPQLKYFTTCSDTTARNAQLAAVTPVYLHADLTAVPPVAEDVTNVQSDFTVGTENSVQWRRTSGTVISFVNDSTGHPSGNIGVATIMASINGVDYKEVRFQSGNIMVVKDLPNLRVFRDGINSGTAFYYNVADSTFSTGDTCTDISIWTELPIGGEGFTFILMPNDYDLSEDSPWIPIGSETHSFLGSFDGSHNVIENMNVQGGDYAGFFGKSTGNFIRNLDFSDAHIVGAGSYAGTLCGYSMGRVDSCHVVRDTITATGQYVGGLVGYLQGDSMRCCSNRNGSVVTSSTHLGGLVGYANSTCFDSLYCKDTRVESTIAAADASVFVGGICGYMIYGGIRNCHTHGGLVKSTRNCVGGIVGYGNTTNSKSIYITRCSNTAEVQGYGAVGGIMGSGYLDTYSTYVNFCYNHGKIYATGNAGGIAGQNTIIEYCYNTGEISSKGTVGGLAGMNATVRYCFNLGKVIQTSTLNISGIVGYKAILSHCINAGEVEGKKATKVAGIFNYGEGSATNCVNVARVSGVQNLRAITTETNAPSCFYDRQMVPGLHSSDGSTGLNTADMLGTALQAALGDVWIYEDGMYPRLRWTDTCDWARDAAIAAATPLILDTTSVLQTVDDISSRGTLSGSGGASWTLTGTNGFSLTTESGTQYLDVNPYLERATLNVSVNDSIYKRITIRNNSKDNPVIIKDLTEFINFRNYINSGNFYYYDVEEKTFHTSRDEEDWIELPLCGYNTHFRLDADLDMNAYNTWESVGRNNNVFERFMGYFNGNNKRITNFKNINNNQNNKGLFGYVRYGSIDSCNVSGYLVAEAKASPSNWGGVVAYLDNSSLSFCSFSGTGITTNLGRNVGGVCGYALNSTISDCYNAAPVTGADVGGVCGHMAGGSLTRCFNGGIVRGNNATGSYNVGGVVGTVNTTETTTTPIGTTISHCYNTNEVYGNKAKYTGGILGYGTQSTLTYAYNTGVTDGGTGSVNAIMGNNSTYSSEVYNDVQMNPNMDFDNLLTVRMLGSSLQSGLGSEYWVYEDGLYPRLKGLSDNDAAVVGANPVHLFSNQNHLQTRTQFTVGTAYGTGWSHSGTGDAFDVSDLASGNVGILNCGEDTLTCTRNGYSKNYFFIVDKLQVMFLKEHTCGDPYFWLPANKTYMRSGTYVATFMSQTVGCDSIVTLELSIPRPYTVSTGLENVKCKGARNGWARAYVTGGFSDPGCGHYYSWVNVDAPNDTLSRSLQVDDLGPGTYVFTVTDIIYRDCFKSDTVTITEPDSLLFGITASSSNCYAADDGSITLHIQGGVDPYYVSWTGSDGGSTGQRAFSLSADSVYVLTDLPDGVYKVIVTDGNGCTTTDTTCTIADDDTHYSIVADGITTMYDNAEHSVSNFTLTINGGTPEVLSSGERLIKATAAYNDYLRIHVSGASRTDVGVSNNTVDTCIVIRRHTDTTLPDDTITCQYNIDYTDGAVTITKRTVMLTTATQIELLSYGALHNETVVTTGDGFAPGQSITFTNFPTLAQAGAIPNKPDTAHVGGISDVNYDIMMVYGTLALRTNDSVIVFCAATGSRMYDGTEFSNGNITSVGLPDGYTFTATVNGTITDAGSVVNRIDSASIVIRDAGGTDVTENYPNKLLVDGTLTVTKRTVTLSSQSAGKVYDGTPLVRNTLTQTGDGFAATDITGEISVTGTRTDVGTVSNTISYATTSAFKASNYNLTQTEGTLTVTARPLSVAGDSLTLNYDGYYHEVSYFTVSGLAPGHSAGGLNYSTGSRLEVGTYPGSFTGTLVINDTSANDVTSNYQIATPYATGKLVIKQRPEQIIISSESLQKYYDKAPLSGNNYTVLFGGSPVPMASVGKYVIPSTGDTLRINGSGSSITNAGSIANEFTYTIDHPNNYREATLFKGMLTVSPLHIIMEKGSANKVYDGYPLTDTEVEYDGDQFAEGEGILLTGHASITRVGTTDNTVSYEFAEGTLPQNYNIDTIVGTLTVTQTPAAIIISSPSSEWTYDGTDHYDHNYIVTFDGSTQSGVDTTYGQFFVLPTRDTLAVKADGDAHITNVGTQTNGFTYELQNSDCYSTSITADSIGTLTVNKAALSITIKDTMTYDGTALVTDYTAQADTLVVTGLVAGDSLTAGAVTTNNAKVQTYLDSAATYKSEITTAFATANGIANYDVSYDFTQVIVKRPVTLTSADDGKVYDGTPLTNGTVNVSGDGWATGQGASYDVTGTQTGVGSSSNVFGYTLNTGTDSSNYDITKVEGTLTVTARSLTIQLDTTKVYDGTVFVSEYAATGRGYTVTGLQNGATVTAGTVTSASAAVGTYTDSAATTAATITTDFATSDGIGNYAVTYDLRQTITKADIISLTCPSGDEITKVYDATALQPAATATTSIAGDTIKVEYKTAASGWSETVASQTNSGTLTVNVRATNPNYDTATCSYTLTITQRPITVAARDTNFYYDGTAHNASQMHAPRYTINDSTQLVSGHNLVTDVTSADQTDLGSTPIKLTTVTIYDAGSTNVTANYLIDTVWGTLTVSGFPGAITITSASAELECNGTAQKKEEYAVTFAGSPVAALTGSNGKKFVLPTVNNDTLTVTPTFAGITTKAENAPNNNVYTYVLQHDVQYVGTRTVTYGTIKMYDSLKVVTAETPVTCNGAGDGKSDVTISGGKKNAGNYSYKLDGGTLTATTGTVNLTNLGSGSHSFYVKDSLGYEKTVTITITQPDALTLTLTTDAPVYGDGTIMSHSTGGNGGNKYKLNGSNENNHGVYNGLSAGSYTVTVTDTKGCTSTESATLTATIVTETEGLTRSGQSTSYASDSTVSRSGSLTDFPALTRSGEVIAQPALDSLRATRTGQTVTVEVYVKAVGSATVLELEVATDGSFTSSTMMYTYKFTGTSLTTGWKSHGFADLPAGNYHIRARLYNGGGAVTRTLTDPVAVP